MPFASVFHGDAAEAYALKTAIIHNCSCETDKQGGINGQCSAHRALLDQRFLDGILWGRHILAHLLREEFE